MFRILTILVLGMLAYFGLKNMVKGLEEPASGDDRRDDDDGGGRGVGGVGSDDAGEMSEDPVCRTFVEQGSSVWLEHDGRRVYFCSEACRDRFLAGSGRDGE